TKTLFRAHSQTKGSSAVKPRGKSVNLTRPPGALSNTAPGNSASAGASTATHRPVPAHRAIQRITLIPIEISQGHARNDDYQRSSPLSYHRWPEFLGPDRDRGRFPPSRRSEPCGIAAGAPLGIDQWTTPSGCASFQVWRRWARCYAGTSRKYRLPN